MNDLISVVIPTIGKNGLERAINSVLIQSHRNIELILVDDTTGQSISIPENELLIIKLSTGGARGVSFSRNLGILAAKGSWVAFLDDDDFWDSDHLEKLLCFAKATNLDFAISSACVYPENRVRPIKCLQIHQDPFSALYKKIHLGKSPRYLPTSGYLVKKELAAQIRFDESLIDRENLYFIYRCFLLGSRISQSEEVTLNIEYNSKNSLSRANLESEIYWLCKLKTIDSNFAQNFKFESIRNFLRIGKVGNAMKILFS